jgi:hypothetical protein
MLITNESGADLIIENLRRLVGRTRTIIDETSGRSAEVLSVFCYSPAGHSTTGLAGCGWHPRGDFQSLDAHECFPLWIISTLD